MNGAPEARGEADHDDAGIQLSAACAGQVDDVVSRRSGVQVLGRISVYVVPQGASGTGIRDSVGEEGRRGYFEKLRAKNPGRRTGAVDDMVVAGPLVTTDPAPSGVTVRAGGGESRI
ncbi:hypothetical protein [Streptomyces sp. NBC_01497]|uniref:hypothetical protein n=1 Tax=Streptomyces sp. NBC_01497 TaxID=2903885 RepID=UPI002E325C78|nr:hypothetical protein [Streptomyces sp. NBC_01497]